FDFDPPKTLVGSIVTVEGLEIAAMPRPMSPQEWSAFESTVRSYCEIRAHCRALAAQKGFDPVLNAHMTAALGRLEQRLEALRDGDEIARERARREDEP